MLIHFLRNVRDLPHHIPRNLDNLGDLSQSYLSAEMIASWSITVNSEQMGGVDLFKSNLLTLIERFGYKTQNHRENCTIFEIGDSYFFKLEQFKQAYPNSTQLNFEVRSQTTQLANINNLVSAIDDRIRNSGLEYTSSGLLLNTMDFSRA